MKLSLYISVLFLLTSHLHIMEPRGLSKAVPFFFYWLLGASQLSQEHLKGLFKIDPCNLTHAVKYVTFDINLALLGFMLTWLAGLQPVQDILSLLNCWKTWPPVTLVVRLSWNN